MVHFHFIWSVHSFTIHDATMTACTCMMATLVNRSFATATLTASSFVMLIASVFPLPNGRHIYTGVDVVHPIIIT